MRSLRKYKITVEDESHISEIASAHFTIPLICVIAVSLIILGLIISGLIIIHTPLRRMLPGYLQESQRSATEYGLLRLDSLMEVYEKDRAFLDNFLKVTDIDRNPTDSAGISRVINEEIKDTLIGPGKNERAFMASMEENERFNVSVVAPLAAENMIFYPLAGSGIFSENTRNSTDGKVIIPKEENVRSAAEGTVLAVYYSAAENGYVIVLQHNHGFATSYIHAGNPLVAVGDNVKGGQAIAWSPSPDGKGLRSYTIRMWHNGLPMIPFEYLGGSSFEPSATQKYEEPRGK